MKKRLSLLLTLCLSGTFAVFAQQETTTSIYGFVRSDYFLDSRATKTSIQDLHSFYPLYTNLNAHGDDLNAVANAGLNSVTTRLGVNINGTGILGASSSQSAMEMDLSGAPNYYVMRLRQAYIKLKFTSSELLVGQTWHPLFTSAVMPNVLSLNTGSPFQPFNRSPQIRYDYMKGNLKWTAAGVWQVMSTSDGPLGSVATYQRNALIPNLYASVEYKKDEWLGGIGLDYKCILPERTIYDSINATPVINNKRLHTPTLTVYGLYKTPEIMVQAKALFGQNLVDHALIGGYAITPKHDYIPYNTLSSYVNVVAGKVHQVGMLAGYSTILGPAKDLPVNSKFYGLGAENANLSSEKMAKSIYRLSPSYSYNIGKWKVGAELEITAADWSIRQADGSLNRYETTTNCRLYGIAMYKF